jgi:quercetin 2,3-dioxygenase
MKAILHKANTRGHANYGWLDTHYTFSFADYYDPEMIHFGALRVLNDDWIDKSKGFDRHPHDNMEIVTIPLEGIVEHKDSMNNVFEIRQNDIQIMSAGTGIFHSEYNKQTDKAVRLLQIWVYPVKKNITPRYDQKTFDPQKRINQWQRIVSPDEPEAVMINQQAYFSLLNLDKGKTIDYTFKDPKHGAYVFLIDGEVKIGELTMEKRDGAGFWETSSLSVLALKKCELLLMEVPMAL